MPFRTVVVMLLVFHLGLLTACGESGDVGGSTGGGTVGDGGGGDGTVEPPPEEDALIDCADSASLPALDAEICQIKMQQGLTGDPTAGLIVPDIGADPLTQLGRDLFFTKALSGRGDVACASCHDPRPPFFGSDGLSLSVGVNAFDPDLVGPGRLHNPDAAAASADPEADAGPNVPRRALTTFNSVLYKSALFFDGRIRWKDPADHSRGMITPDSPMFDIDGSVVLDAAFPLLQAQARRPVGSAAEMRGFGMLPGEHGAVMRDYLASRLGQYGDAASELPGNTWNQRFEQVFGVVDSDSGQWVTYERIAEALAAYQASQLFVQNPWRDYLYSGKDVLTEQQKRGALLFFKDQDQGGAGCARCHSGDHFTDEKFHIIAVPQFGRGVGEGEHASDRGFGLQSWNREADDYKFRTPSLLNVAHGKTFGHTGAWSNLRDAVLHHLNVQQSVNNYDWSLAALEQFVGLSVIYQDAQNHTRAALDTLMAQRSVENPGVMLTDVELSEQQADDLVAFLQALSDYRIAGGDIADFAPWVASGTDPDGCRLGSSCVFNPVAPAPVAIWPPLSELEDRSPAVLIDQAAYAPADGNGVRVRAVNDVAVTESCVVQFTPKGLTADHPLFDEVAASVGLGYQHQYEDFEQKAENVYGVVYKLGGGAAAADMNNDCYPDVYLPRGVEPALLLENTGGVFSVADSAETALTGNIASATLADLDGDGFHDIVVAGFARRASQVVPGNGALSFAPAVNITEDGTSQAIYSVSAGDYSLTGRLDLFASFWSASSSSQQQYLWHNGGDFRFYDATGDSGLRGEIAEQFTFVGNFKDVTGNGWPDLLSVADFGRSQIFHNQNGVFTNVTRSSPVTDENGMGVATLDVNHDGHLDWFVTSIYADESDGTIISISGNRLYLNDGNGNFSDVTDQYGVRDGSWGWAACAADLTNNGYEDITQTNGWGHLRHDPDDPENPFKGFVNQPPKLFLRHDASGFDEAAVAEGMLAGEGRGLICADFDRDGAVDILILNNHGPVHFYRNNARELFPDNRFLTVRLRNRGPNWEAIGARVFLELDGPSGQRELMRDLGGNNYLSQNPVEAHFGLGTAEQLVQMRVEWPPVAIDGVVYRDVSVISAEQLGINRMIDIVHPECDVAGRCGQP